MNYTYSIYYKYNLPLTPRSITCYIHPIHLISNIWKDPNTNRVLHANIVNNCTIIIRSLPYQACIKHWFIYTISNDYRHTWYFEFGQVWGRGWGKLVNSSIHGNRSPHITDSINQLHTKQRHITSMFISVRKNWTVLLLLIQVHNLMFGKPFKSFWV